MKFKIKHKSKGNTDYIGKFYNLEVGTIRLHYLCKDMNNINIGRNQYVKLRTKYNTRGIIRKVLLGINAFMNPDDIIIDYDSLLQLIGYNKEMKSKAGTAEIDIDITIVKNLGHFRYLLQTPNLPDRFSFKLGLLGIILGVLGFITGIVSLIVTIISISK